MITILGEIITSKKNQRNAALTESIYKLFIMQMSDMRLKVKLMTLVGENKQGHGICWH